MTHEIKRNCALVVGVLWLAGTLFPIFSPPARREAFARRVIQDRTGAPIVPTPVCQRMDGAEEEGMEEYSCKARLSTAGGWIYYIIVLREKNGKLSLLRIYED